MSDKFLVRPQLDEKIRDVLAGDNVRCAVAFWGRGAEQLFTTARVRAAPVKIICNLLSGGTNPEAIKALRKLLANVEVRHRSDLHAKFYLSDKGCVVASANASTNGLSLQNIEQAKWIEAGVSLTNFAAPAVWFDELWGTAKSVTPEDLLAAEALWDRRQVLKPALQSFSDFDPSTPSFPLMDWWEDVEGKTVETSVEKQVGYFNSKLEALITESVVVHKRSEFHLFPRGRWILRWKRIGGWKVDRKIGFEWMCVDQILVDSYQYYEDDGTLTKPSHVALKMLEKQSGQGPFPVNNDPVADVLADLLETQEFRFIGKGWTWTTKRVKLMQDFWFKAKDNYVLLRTKS